jgi:hypothetical protein
VKRNTKKRQNGYGMSLIFNNLEASKQAEDGICLGKASKSL